MSHVLDERHSSESSSEAGFTLVEMLVVLAIVGLLVGLVAPRVFNQLAQAKVRTAHIQIESFKNSLDLFFLDNGRYPTTSEGLTALTTRPSDMATWGGPYLRGTTVPRDPWNGPYAYRAPGQNGRTYEITSNGPPGEGEDAGIAAARSPVGSRMKGSADPRSGYVLLEALAALLLTLIVMRMAFPTITFPISSLGLGELASQTASLLRDARTTAISRNTTVPIVFDGVHRLLRSGPNAIRIPPDIDVKLTVGGNCEGTSQRASFAFRPDGTNCGAMLALSTRGARQWVQVDWADGRVLVSKDGR